MKIIGFIFLMVTFQTFSQTFRLKEAVKEKLMKTDLLIEIEERIPTETKFEFQTSELNSLKLLMLSDFFNKSKNRIHPLKESESLTQLASFCLQFWGNSIHSNSKKWNKMQKHIRRAMRQVDCNFGIVESISFRLELLDNNRNLYYYDPKGEKGELNLFKGSKPKTKKGEVIKEKKPLDFFTEKQIVAKIQKIINRKKLNVGLRKGIYFCVGIAIELDSKTLYKNAIPSARVVVLCGVKRMQMIEIKRGKKK
ncbi:MAG: hypothetical protein HYR91_11115 [Flavobacteriia bacterium]|nr:hypothetical protein [Flavobacteriia bacterium]